jgi:hypothetical protein
MSIPKFYNFDYYAGDLYQLVLYPRNDDGTPFDLNGYSAEMEIATERGNPNTTVLEITGQINLNPPRILATITPEDGAELNLSDYVYDIEVRNDENPEDVYTFLTGNISVTQDVTLYGNQDYETLDSGGVVVEDIDVIIDGGIPTSVFYSVFDGGTP